MDLSTILKPEACALNVSERDKAGALRRIASLAAVALGGAGPDEGEILSKLSEREAQGSTGFGNGVAIPHARMKGMQDFMLFIVTSRRGVAFDALDRKRVTLFLVLLGPDERVSDNLKILAAISHLLTSTGVKREILSSLSVSAACEVFLRHVRAAGPGGQPAEKMKLLHVVLYVEEFFYDILEFFIEQGIEGATILDSSGMGQYISNIPLFASFIGFMNENKNSSRTIMALIPESRLNEIVGGIEEITGDLEKKEGAMVIVTDVSFYKGSMKMM
jgi:PTS system nitrogen regulatory IIA component